MKRMLLVGAKACWQKKANYAACYKQPKAADGINRAPADRSGGVGKHCEVEHGNSVDAAFLDKVADAVGPLLQFLHRQNLFGHMGCSCADAADLL